MGLSRKTVPLEAIKSRMIFLPTLHKDNISKVSVRLCKNEWFEALLLNNIDVILGPLKLVSH